MAAMKTAVSLPDDLFNAADALADELGISRSELYARAIGHYVATKRRADVAASLKAFYGEGIESDRAVVSYARKVLERSQW